MSTQTLIIVTLSGAGLLALLLLYARLRRAQRTAAKLTSTIATLETQQRQSQAALAQRERDIATTKAQSHHLAHTIIPLSLALTAEKDYSRLLRMILSAAQTFCHADAGTLYLRTADDHLDPVILHNISLGLLLEGSGGELMPIPPLALYDAAGQPNQRNITTYTAHSGNAINVADVYSAAASQYDFSGPKAFDLTMDYRSQSFLTIPLKNNQSDVIGVLQLINAHDQHTHEVISFSPEVQELAEALAALAAAALIVAQRDQPQRQPASEIDMDFED